MSTSELTNELNIQPEPAKPASTKRRTKVVPIQYRIQVFIRFAFAFIGGYVVSALLAMVISLGFKETPVSAVITATMLAFICHVGIFIWVFMQRSLLKSISGIVISLVVLSIAYFGLGGSI
ncbi:hypothetical protein [Acinetobacter ihumii]|uniref:hypothetical protein n=1 Tax=Acinetobacter ihumii TaxID=2483802 RepID=UPI001031AB0C|nr:hypothetical protein [Acinetobacter ihumii]